MEALIRDLLGEQLRRPGARRPSSTTTRTTSTRASRSRPTSTGCRRASSQECLVGARRRGRAHGPAASSHRGTTRSGCAASSATDRRPPDDPVRAQDLDGRAVHDGLQLDRPARPHARFRAHPDRSAHRRRRARSARPPTSGIRSAAGSRRCRGPSASACDGIELNREVERIELPERRVVIFADGEAVAFDELDLHASAAPTSGSRYRRCRRRLPTPAAPALPGDLLINLGSTAPGVSDKHWVYFYEDAFPFHRLSFPANFSPDNVPAGKSSISTEVAFSEHRPLDRNDVVDQTIERSPARATSSTPRRPHRARARRGDRAGLRHLRPRPRCDVATRRPGSRAIGILAPVASASGSTSTWTTR